MAEKETPSPNPAAPAAAPAATPAPAAAASATPSPAPATGAAKPAAAAPAATPAAGAKAAAPAANAAAPQQADASKGGAKTAAAEKAKKALGNLKNLGALADTKELVRDLASKDRQTRKMARYFALSVIGVLGVFVASGYYLKGMREEDKVKNVLTDTGEQGKNLGDFIAKQAEEAKRKFSTQSLGTFSIELKGAQGDDGKPAKRPPNVLDLAEVEIVVECDKKDTCDFIEDRMPAVRNQLTSLFTAMDRDDFLVRERKDRLRNRIREKLNQWLPNGSIQKVFFNKLIIS